jgi:hypothetical protein
VASDAACLALDGIGDTRSCEVGERSDGKVCDERCLDHGDCRSGFRCEAGLCREPQTSVTAAQDAGSTSTPNTEPNTEPTALAAANQVLPAGAPLVMLLADTSGSMERLPDCTCSTPGCDECLPDCATSQTNRWQQLLGTLTGSFAEFGCESLSRTADNGATYDLSYVIPYSRPSAVTRQRSDGVIDAYASRIRFGTATFDARATYSGLPDLQPLAAFDFMASDAVAGAFSYAGTRAGGTRIRPDGTGVGEIVYPSVMQPYFEDKGVQNTRASAGALLVAAADQPVASNAARLKANLRDVRPFGGTPIAAALDDLFYFFAEDPAGEPRMASERRYVILVTDGTPEDNYRLFPSPGCGCKTPEECAGEDPARMRCPYPAAVEAARHLHCGFDPAFCEGPIDKLYIIGFVVDAAARAELDELAAAGGSDHARSASSQPELQAALRSVLEEIAASEPH